MYVNLDVDHASRLMSVEPPRTPLDHVARYGSCSFKLLSTYGKGTVGYSIYVGSLWAHQVHGIRIFLIVAGGFLGISTSPNSLPERL